MTARGDASAWAAVAGRRLTQQAHPDVEHREAAEEAKGLDKSRRAEQSGRAGGRAGGGSRLGAILCTCTARQMNVSIIAASMLLLATLYSASVYSKRRETTMLSRCQPAEDEGRLRDGESWERAGTRMRRR